MAQHLRYTLRHVAQPENQENSSTNIIFLKKSTFCVTFNWNSSTVYHGLCLFGPRGVPTLLPLGCYPFPNWLKQTTFQRIRQLVLYHLGCTCIHTTSGNPRWKYCQCSWQRILLSSGIRENGSEGLRVAMSFDFCEVEQEGGAAAPEVRFKKLLIKWRGGVKIIIVRRVFQNELGLGITRK